MASIYSFTRILLSEVYLIKHILPHQIVVTLKTTSYQVSPFLNTWTVSLSTEHSKILFHKIKQNQTMTMMTRQDPSEDSSPKERSIASCQPTKLHFTEINTFLARAKRPFKYSVFQSHLTDDYYSACADSHPECPAGKHLLELINKKSRNSVMWWNSRTHPWNKTKMASNDRARDRALY